MSYDVYAPEAFGLQKASRGDVGGAILTPCNDAEEYGGISVLAYIKTSRVDVSPCLDLDSAIHFKLKIATSVEPVFRDLEIDDRGNICLPVDGNVLVLNERQDELLNKPSFLLTRNGLYQREPEKEDRIFRKFETLDSIKPVELNMSRVCAVLHAKFPQFFSGFLLSYGNKYPFFPNARIFPHGKVVVFIEKRQLADISEKVISGKMPLFFSRGAECFISDVESFFVIDAEHNIYSAEILAPGDFLLLWEKEAKRRDRYP